MWSGIFNFNTFWIILILNKKNISPGRRGFPHNHPSNVYCTIINICSLVIIVFGRQATMYPDRNNLLPQ